MKQNAEVCITVNNAQRSSYVKNRITAALLSLMEEKPVDDISVYELTERAGVGRVSFYRNFRDKDDVLRFFISEETEKWLGEDHVSYLAAGRTKEFAVFLLRHMREYRGFFDLLMRDGRMYLLEDEFDSRIRLYLDQSADPWHIAFLTGGFYKLFRYWAACGYRESPEEIAAYMR